MSSRFPKLAPAALIVIGSLALGGCASKGYVRDQIAAVNQRIDALDAKIGATDATAKQAQSDAQGAAGAAQNNAQRIDQLNARVDGVEQKLAEQAKQPKKKARN